LVIVTSGNAFIVTVTAVRGDDSQPVDVFFATAYVVVVPVALRFGAVAVVAPVAAAYQTMVLPVVVVALPVYSVPS
jgi:hypothetical protein